MDAAKAVAAVASGRHGCADLLHRRQPIGSALPVLAIPTTPGTGSEMNRSAIVTDPLGGWRDGLRSDLLSPRVALVDPALALSLPDAVTAQTGFDVFAHAVESYVSPRSNPVADTLALEAARRVLAALPRALEEPAGLRWRNELALAGTLMGLNLSCVGTCLPHRLDKAVCALHPGIPHGQCVAFFYPAWAAHGHPGNPPRFAAMAQLMDPALVGVSVDEAARRFSDLVSRWIESIGMQTTPRGFGVRRGEIPEILRRIPGDCSINPVPVSARAAAQLLEEVIQ